MCEVCAWCDAGIKRVALLDFDVHHGNGTEACVAATAPSLRKFSFKTPFSEGSQTFPTFSPWLDTDDAENILFARCVHQHRQAGLFLAAAIQSSCVCTCPQMLLIIFQQDHQGNISLCLPAECSMQCMLSRAFAHWQGRLGGLSMFTDNAAMPQSSLHTGARGTLDLASKSCTQLHTHVYMPIMTPV